MAHTFNSSTREAEADVPLLVQGQPDLHSEVQDSTGFIIRSSLCVCVCGGDQNLPSYFLRQGLSLQPLNFWSFCLHLLNARSKGAGHRTWQKLCFVRHTHLWSFWFILLTLGPHQTSISSHRQGSWGIEDGRAAVDGELHSPSLLTWCPVCDPTAWSQFPPSG